MPGGPSPLKIKLLVAETGPNDHADFEPGGIRGRLDVLFGATSGWISTINVIRDALEHEIVFTHRTIVIPNISREAAATCLETVRSLADGLCNPKSSFSLRVVSKDVKNIRYMPCTSNQSDLQKHFNCNFVLFALRYTVGDVFFEDVDADAQCFLQRNPQKWFLGPLQVGVFLSDFLVLFDKLATLLPLEAVLTEGQPSDDLKKEVILLQVLKYGAKYAPALRAACTVGIGDLDKDSIRRKFIEADTAVKRAMDNACSKLQELRHLDDDKFGDSVQEINRELAESIKPRRQLAV
ncbi:hypothetical protein AOL_s00076g336 [Orbilia oligospora ATCC 24927]|uniref:Uncharacterized protein n=1 Tax=Arthrobotrys oligospora (strain ATCC 24927 / CBS 115.81 / DSM 1491) TaxID=756982 RepID=G1X9M9_ARTOA|nr:hypothetical protein AOL_s00076g336 [Orbilia oligospora ATCC 24927]EGX50131.1 hypothetical protein AOL_s00076g336 [Orbilia oligospora ATCC 24927]